MEPRCMIADCVFLDMRHRLMSLLLTAEVRNMRNVRMEGVQNATMSAQSKECPAPMQTAGSRDQQNPAAIAGALAGLQNDSETRFSHQREDDAGYTELKWLV